jgi:hypothetical protein
MWCRIFTALSLARSTAIFLLSIGCSTIPCHFFAPAMGTMNGDRYHGNFHLSNYFLLLLYHCIPFLTTTQEHILVHEESSWLEMRRRDSLLLRRRIRSVERESQAARREVRIIHHQQRQYLHLANWTANMPTPPAAPWIRTR